MKKEHIFEFDFIRAVCALLIIFYHVLCMYESTPEWSHFPISSHCVNGDWGHSAIVSIFFMISGTALAYNYPSIKKGTLKTFYFKRWLGIFPAFYLVWLYTYLTDVIKARSFFYAASPKYLLLSLFGVDGYFYYLHPNYYGTGEWFLGALLMLYLLYPVLSFCYNHCFKLFTVLITVLFLLNLKMDWFLISDADNLITCIFCFWIGMCFTKYLKAIRGNKLLAVICGILAAIFLFVPLNLNQVFSMVVLAVLLFVVLFNLAPLFYRADFLARFSNTTSSLSYELFLVHHLLIYYIFGYLGTTPVIRLSVGQQIIYTVVIFVLSFFFAWTVSLIIKKLTDTKFFRWLKGKFLAG